MIHRQPTDIVFGDFREAPLTKENINIKEFWAVAKVLEILPAEIRDCRVNVQVDNQAVLRIWMGRGGRARGMYPVAKMIFHLTQDPFDHVLCRFSEHSSGCIFKRSVSFGLYAVTRVLE